MATWNKDSKRHPQTACLSEIQHRLKILQTEHTTKQTQQPEMQQNEKFLCAEHCQSINTPEK